MPSFDCRCGNKQPFVLAGVDWMHWGRGQAHFSTMESDTIHYCDTSVQHETHSFKQPRQHMSAQTSF